MVEDSARLSPFMARTFPNSRTLRLELYRVTINGDAAEWNHESRVKVSGDLVDVFVPEKTNGFHSEPPTLEEMKQWHDGGYPSDTFKD